ncbi:MAG: hypothetical protein KGD67_12110, partial [Candidatus Lokiarchaeota archaeon]|nr:hypothetical protein [Candidatus Lokiarchaeota archaeon]
MTYKLNIGYELEAGFLIDNEKERLDRKIYTLLRGCGFEITTDGSIHTINHNSISKEIKSKIYTIEKKEDLKKVFDDFKTIEKGITEVNNSMGLHFHISFNKPLYYFELCNYD